MDNTIFILKGEEGEGKTEAMQKWIKSRDARAHGILMPKTDGQYHFFNPYMDVSVLAEAPEEMKDPDLIYKVGGLKLSKKAFKVAKSWLRMKPPLNSDYFIIDGLGKLEFKGEGLEPEFSNVVKSAKSGKIKHTLIIIVNESVHKKLIRHFKLHSADIIEKDQLSEIP